MTEGQKEGNIAKYSITKYGGLLGLGISFILFWIPLLMGFDKELFVLFYFFGLLFMFIGIILLFKSQKEEANVLGDRIKKEREEREKEIREEQEIINRKENELTEESGKFDIGKLKLSQQIDEAKTPEWVILLAVLASLLCFIAGIWMLTITSEATASGEGGSIFESAIHATGVYFIAKGFFLGPALYLMGKRR